jgi:hypothetical protein
MWKSSFAWTMRDVYMCGNSVHITDWFALLLV